MKYGFSGDNEFTIENYWKLPYSYVLNAIVNLNELEQEKLHNYERPISYLAYQNAEINRDRKKQRKPYKPNDFYIYDNKELSNLPEPKYGAAALELIKHQLFPSWALFVFSDLKARAADACAPELLCLQCEDAIILAPSINEQIINGMLIASESASGKARTMKSPCGLVVEARMPRIMNKYQAGTDEEVKLLRIINQN